MTTPAPETAASVHRHARAEQFAPAIANRTVRLNGAPYAAFHHVLVTKGRVRIVQGESEVLRSAESGLAYLPPLHGAAIVVEAGASAIVTGMSPIILADAVGSSAESFSLRIFSEQPFVQDGNSTAFSEVLPLAEGFGNELRLADRGSWMVVSAYARLMLTALWRASGAKQSGEAGHGAPASILQRFRQLVETHFRDHLPISSYATQLGLTPDRLHAICRRQLRRTPLKLVHERVQHEAQLRLELSSRTVTQISDDLGFRDPTYFCQFFKRHAGRSPADYRKATHKRPSTAPPIDSTFPDWP